MRADNEDLLSLAHSLEFRLPFLHLWFSCVHLQVVYLQGSTFWEMMAVAAGVGEQWPRCSLRSGGGPRPHTFIDSRSTHLSQRQATFLVSTLRFTLGWFGNDFIEKLAKCHLSKCVQFACKLAFIWPANSSSAHRLNTGCTAPEVSEGLFLWAPCWALN